jgi:Zn-dependent protease
MRYSYPLFSINGVLIKLHLVFIFVFVLVPPVFYFFVNVLTAISVLIFLILLAFSILIHEYAHVLVESRHGLYTGEIILLPFSGVPVRQSMPKNDLDELRIAMVGPALSAGIAAVLAPMVYFGYGWDTIWRTTILEFSPLIILFKINLAMAVFNIIPIFPMDGGRMLRAYLTHKFGFVKATKWAAWITYILLAVLIALGLFFNLLVIILAFFLYGAAQGKKRFDLAAEALGAGDSREKIEVLRRYDKKRSDMLDQAENLRIRAEELLFGSSLKELAKPVIRFKNLLEEEVFLGKTKKFQKTILSIIVFFIRARDFSRYWITHRPVLKSIAFMLLATFSFSMVWLLSPKLAMVFTFLFLFSFAMGAFIIYYHTRSKSLLRYSAIACVLWLIYIISNYAEPYLDLSFRGFLIFEAVRATLVPATGSLFFISILRSNDFFKMARVYMPVPMLLIVIALFLFGTGIFFYECYLLSAFESDLDTVRFVLRYDIAYLAWFIASALMFISLIYLLYVGSISRYGRITTLKFITSTFVLIILISFLSRDLLLITAARYSTEPEELDMKVGLNLGNITELDTDLFDRAVHFEVTWENIYRNGPGSPDWSDSDWQLDYATRNNIEVYLQIHPLAPAWFSEKHEHSIMRDQWGSEFFWIDQEPGSNASRIWDLSFNDADVIKAKINFTEEAVKRYQNISSVKFIGIQNEPTYPVSFNNLRIASYDNSTVDAFVNWTASQYEFDLDLFRNDTSVLINNWVELAPPKSSVHPLWDKWLEFREESLIWLVENLTAAVKRNTDKPVTVKVMAHFLARFNTVQSGLSTKVVARFFELSDAIALDLYPLTSADLRHSLEFYKKLAGGKPIIVPEFNMALGSNMPGGGASLYYNLVILNEYADYVFIFSGGTHYIYGMQTFDHSPMSLGIRLYRIHRNGGDVYSLYDELLLENFSSIPNYYEVYVLNSQIFGLPIIPWPVLFLTMMPLPIADEQKRKRARNFSYLVILILLIVFGIIANI